MTEEKVFAEVSAKALIKEIREFVKTTPLNVMPGEEGMPIFDRPVIKFADGNDPFFTELKTVIADTHMTPREALARATEKQPSELPEKLSVISWILPITEATRKSNRTETLGPSRFWSHTRWFGEIVNEAVRDYVTDVLTEMGYLAVAPGRAPYLSISTNEKGPYSNWSERHIAFAAGQGAFGLSDGFITDKGMAHRCGSVVTDLVLPANERIVEGPYANCLHAFDGSCGKCIKRCPAGAITPEGHDKNICSKYQQELGYGKVIASNSYDLETSVAGCGLCQTGIPCEHQVPLRIRQSRK